ncbi:Zinc finger BED domain-containing protein RICESLEEPER 1 [Folsomia candida]|uniref:Zinc finger BED domain-containing protein RICESLEEPER 1 n=1 Tax=Folsomia candida TaxID=158441 RepID=A0A226DQ94_FOLCA|nr:Zinc finger BED domain-containing protein RICESLEEPER 1 [Folsomia candida]
MGVKVQFIHGWRMHQLVIGFQHFPESHTGDNIKRCLQSILEKYGITNDKVGTVTADNASNVLAAFKIAKIDVDNNEDLIYEDELEISDNEEYGDSDLEDFDNTAEETVLQVDMTTERNGCLLQLAIKDAFSECEFASQLLRKVNQVVNYFHRSNFWVNIPPVEPATPRKGKVPGNFTDDDVITLKTIMELLEPFAELTDKFQGDGVTSSLVILGTIHALKCAKEVKIDEDLEPELIKNLWDFKNALCESFITRFSHDMESDEPIINKATGKPRRIVTYNVMRNKNFILAALLDPRIKSVPFNNTSMHEIEFAKYLPTATEAIAYLREAVTSLKPNPICDELVELDNAASSEEEPLIKKKRSMFDLVVVPQTEFEHTIDEVDDYFKTPLLKETDSPLYFWERNEDKYPSLSV